MSRSLPYRYRAGQPSAVFAYGEASPNTLGEHDIEVAVKAVSVNPVDYKIASGVKGPKDSERVLGWDMAGVVKKLGSAVKGFAVGDEVYYAGDLKRPGGNTELHAVDARVVAKKPATLSFAEAAALPLTSLTAWEGLFEGLAIQPDKTEGKTLLVIGGAGGVGSMVIQLAKKLTRLKVIATSSKADSTDWCKSLGADEVINYKSGLAAELKRVGHPEVDFIFCTNNTQQYFTQFVDITKAFGKIVTIVESDVPLDVNQFKAKSISFAWEFMFTRTMFKTPDIGRQGEILKELAALVDAKKIRTTLKQDLGPMTPESLSKAHEMLRSGDTIGKVVLGALA